MPALKRTTITGLASGYRYVFYVKAVNRSGQVSSERGSATVLYDPAPQPPASVSVTPSPVKIGGAAKLNFTASPDASYANITSYRYRVAQYNLSATLLNSNYKANLTATNGMTIPDLASGYKLQQKIRK